MTKFLAILQAAQASMELASIVAQFLERLIPAKDKGQIKKELGLDLMRLAKEENADPDSLALDMAVAKFNANGWDAPSA